MIDKPSPLKGLRIRIPFIIPIKGTGFINQGSGLGSQHLGGIFHPGSLWLIFFCSWLTVRLSV